MKTVGNVRRVLDNAMSEAELLASIVSEAHWRGYLVHHCRPAQNRKGEWSTALQGDRGLPDLILVKPPRVIFIETKSERGQVSPEQWRWIQTLDACRGVECYVIHPRDMGRLSAILEGAA